MATHTHTQATIEKISATRPTKVIVVSIVERSLISFCNLDCCFRLDIIQKLYPAQISVECLLHRLIIAKESRLIDHAIKLLHRWMNNNLSNHNKASLFHFRFSQQRSYCQTSQALNTFASRGTGKIPPALFRLSRIKDSRHKLLAHEQTSIVLITCSFCSDKTQIGSKLMRQR